MADVRTALYRLLGEGGELLYIGMSQDPETRFRIHRKRIPGIVSTQMKWYPSREAAAEAEKRAIFRLAPRFNQVYQEKHPEPLDPNLRTVFVHVDYYLAREIRDVAMQEDISKEELLVRAIANYLAVDSDD